MGKRKRDHHQSWQLVEGIGRLSTVRPVFSRDEEYILSAASNRVLVHSMASGQRIQTIDVQDVQAMALMEDGDVLHCLSPSGGFTQVEWRTGRVVHRRALDSPSQRADFLIHSPMKAFLISTNGKDEGGNLSLAEVGPEKVELHSILLVKKSYTGFACLDDGSSFAAIAKRNLYVGTPVERADSKARFIIRRYKVDEDATAVAISPEHVSVGTKTGKICIFLDIVAKPPNGSPNIRVVHWHANPVRSLAWALDGNYLLSGGEEGVLVFWQIETGHRQFLPRLSGPIDRITVSQSSKKYAIKLRDNALEIINATELESVLRIDGLDIPPRAEVSVAAVCEPQGGHILLAASAPNSHSSILQTFDPCACTTIARTETSYVSHTGKIGHETQRTRQSIRHLAISPCGEWLAVVDEWEQHEEEKIDIVSSQKIESTEVHLKFWKRQQHSTWDLSTRVEAPHGPNQLLEFIVAFPSEGEGAGTSFVSLGSNGSLKIWSSMDDLHKDTRGLSFACQRATDIPKPSLRFLRSGALAVSHDGSTIAAVSEHTIYLLDSSSLQIHARMTLLEAGKVRDMYFNGPNLVVGCQKRVVIFDIVSKQIVWQIKAPHAIIASNSSTSQLALSYANKRGSEVLLFDIASPIPIYAVHVASTALSLLYRPKDREWCVIMSNAMVLRVSCPSLETTVANGALETTVANGALETTVANGASVNSQALSMAYSPHAKRPIETSEVEEGLSIIITSQRLAATFDRPASSMPGMEALFMEFMTIISPPRVTT